MASAADEDPFAPLNLETHGYASFGNVRSWGRDWIDGSEGGTNEFWEAAINVISRPTDRLRLGAQIFVRDVGDYDNGTPQLDWAYADWRAADQFGAQLGRVRVALGLYNEVLDIDAARTPVLLPSSVYSLRSRDLYISTDGGKLYGFLDMAGAGSLEYQFYAGKRSWTQNSDFPPTSSSSDWVARSTSWASMAASVPWSIGTPHAMDWG